MLALLRPTDALSTALQARVDALVRSGRFPHAEAALDAALRALEASAGPALPTVPEIAQSRVIGFAILDLATGRVVAVNDYVLALTGHTRAEFERRVRDWRSLTPPEFVAQDEHALTQVEERGWCDPYEKVWVGRDGARIPIRVSGASLPQSPGKVIVYVEDMRERALAEAAVREREERLNLALQAGELGVWELDLVAGKRLLSPRSAEIYGIPAESLTEREAWRTVIHPDDRAPVEAAFQAMLAGERDYRVEFRIRAEDGSLRWVASQALVHRSADGTPLRVVGIHQDVTQRQAAQAALQESEERLRLAIEGTALGTWDVDARTGLRRWSDEFRAIIGVSPEATADPAFFSTLIHPDDRDWVNDLYARMYKPGSPGLYEAEFRIRRASDGAERWVMTRGRITFDEAGRPLRGVGTMLDITERKRLDEALRTRTRELETVLATVPAAVWFTYDPDVRQVTRNRRAAELMRVPHDGAKGFSPGDGQAMRDLVVLKDGQPVSPRDLPLQRAMQGETINEEEYSFAFGDGSRASLLASAAPLMDEAGRRIGAVAVGLDISERKRAEEHQRLLVHELNHRVKNTLATVQSIAFQTLRGAGVEPGVQALFEARLQALSAAHNILTAQNWESADIADVVDATIGPYRAGRGRFRIAGPSLRLPPREALALSMALHELCTNAAKYGALSAQGGHVAIDWSVAAETGGARRLRFAWTERDGPPVSPPTRRGFGSRLIERGLAAELQGDVEIRFDPAGVVCTFSAPLSAPEEAGDGGASYDCAI